MNKNIVLAVAATPGGDHTATLPVLIVPRPD